MKKVASFALFGHHVAHSTRQFYWDHLPALVRGHHNLYPDWELRVHVDSTYQEDRSRLLRAYEAAGLLAVVHCGENTACCRSMLWRMKPVWDGTVEYVVCRDMDSAPCAKDAKAIKQWIDSGATIHTINDNYQHTATMMGGMVGFKAPAFMAKSPWKTWENMVDSYKGLEQPSGGHDQILMSNAIWNTYCPDVCAHRFAGLPFDAALKACFTKSSEEPLAGLSEKMCQESDTLMPYLGASSYEVPRACNIFDTYGKPEVRDRVLAAEKTAQ
jgi:hypothetical protein